MPEHDPLTNNWTFFPHEYVGDPSTYQIKGKRVRIELRGKDEDTYFAVQEIANKEAPSTVLGQRTHANPYVHIHAPYAAEKDFPKYVKTDPEMHQVFPSLEAELTFEQLPVIEKRRRLADPLFLPTLSQINQAFPLSLHMLPAAREQTIADWTRFCRSTNEHNFPLFYELLTSEYIQALSTYLRERADALKKTEEQPLTVLEVDAGDGKLAHFLTEALHSSPNVRYIATEPEPKRIHPVFESLVIPRLNHKKAMEAFHPTIVISSWMGRDLTRDFRRNPGVKEYILIGEEGTSGDWWETWGVTFDERKANSQTPFEKDGFVRKDLTEMSKLQISKASLLPIPEDTYSQTVSFRRIPLHSEASLER